MKKISCVVAMMLVFCISEKSSAQLPLNIIVAIDTTFAHTGKVEVALSGFGDEATDLYGVYPDKNFNSKVMVCGKVGTVNPAQKKLGMIQLNLKDGTFDSSFGDNGIAINSWGVSDYPNRMYVSNTDSSIFLAGMNASSEADKDHLPALFKLKKNGFPDSSFGGDGHISIRFNPTAHGEFTNIYYTGKGLLALGYISDSTNSSFCAGSFKMNGTFDSTFGDNGKALLPVANETKETLSSVSGFLSFNDSLTFHGELTSNTDSSHSEIIFGRMTEKGFPDLHFGNNGILRTGLSFSTFAGRSLAAAIQPNFDIVVALPPNGISLSMPFSVVRFTTGGRDTFFLDTTYGTKGYVTIGYGPAGSKARGMTIDKNNKPSIAGSTEGSLEYCASTRLNIDGKPDISFNQTGSVVIDVDSGAYSNYLIKFLGTGNKRYISIGASIHNGSSQFLAARFKDDTLTDKVVKTDENSDIHIFPNPVSQNFWVESATGPIQDLKIIDVFGREMGAYYSTVDFKLYAIDVSRLVNGTYYCRIESNKGSLLRKILVVH